MTSLSPSLALHVPRSPLPHSHPWLHLIKRQWLSLVHLHKYLPVCLSAQRNNPMGFAIEKATEYRFIVIPVSNFSLQMDTIINCLCIPLPNL